METPMLILAPLSFLVIWGMFALSSSAVTSLVTLLLSSLLLPSMFMGNTKAFWPCGLLLILMSTGLIVVFAYVVSLHAQEWQRGQMGMLLCLSVSLVAMLFMGTITPLSIPLFSSASISVSILTSLSLLFLLLFLVISFIRVVYSKGGGFRKKF